MSDLGDESQLGRCYETRATIQLKGDRTRTQPLGCVRMLDDAGRAIARVGTEVGVIHDFRLDIRNSSS